MDPDKNTEHIRQTDIGAFKVWTVCRYQRGTISEGTEHLLYTQDGTHWSKNPACTSAHIDEQYIGRKLTEHLH